MEVNVAIRRSSDGRQLPDVDKRHIRRDYGLYDQRTVSVGTSRVSIDTAISDIQFLYVEVIGDAVVNLYKDNSPEWWEFTTTLLLFDIESCSSISFKADTNATLYIFMAGD